MGTCRKPQCTAQMATGSAYCAQHRASPNVVLPSVPMSMAVREAARAPARPLAHAPGAGPAGRAPHHRRRGAVDFGTGGALLLEGQAKNLHRMRHAHAAQLAKRSTDQEAL